MTDSKISCPCPFCNATTHLKLVRLSETQLAVTCDGCQIDGPYRETVSEALSAWGAPYKRLLEAIDENAVLRAAVADSFKALTSDFVKAAREVSVARVTIMMEAIRRRDVSVCKKTTTAVAKKTTKTTKVKDIQ